MKKGIVLATSVLVAVSAGVAIAAKVIPDVSSTAWIGAQRFKLSLKGVGKIASDGANSLTIDASDDFTYTNSDGLSVPGSILQDGKKLLATLDASAIATLEGQLATIIESALALEGIDAGTVTLDIDAAKLKLKAKLKVGKDGNSIKFSLSGKFEGVSSTLGPGKGKFKVKGILFQV